MGYTHYWTFKKKVSDIENGAEKFKNAVVKDNCVGCFLNDGEEIKLSCCKAESDRIMVKVEK